VEPAAGLAPQQRRSLKTPSATDLVENRGTDAPALIDGSNGSTAGGGFAAFPLPGPPPPVEAPATSDAAVSAAVSPGPGWATFGESSSTAAQPASAAGSADMSKGFGSFEQFAQVLAIPPTLMCTYT
jgi:hypothetical protein